jgi:hypothetical protein
MEESERTRSAVEVLSTLFGTADQRHEARSAAHDREHPAELFSHTFHLVKQLPVERTAEQSQALVTPVTQAFAFPPHLFGISAPPSVVATEPRATLPIPSPMVTIPLIPTAPFLTAPIPTAPFPTAAFATVPVPVPTAPLPAPFPAATTLTAPTPTAPIATAPSVSARAGSLPYLPTDATICNHSSTTYNPSVSVGMPAPAASPSAGMSAPAPSPDSAPVLLFACPSSHQLSHTELVSMGLLPKRGPAPNRAIMLMANTIAHDRIYGVKRSVRDLSKAFKVDSGGMRERAMRYSWLIEPVLRERLARSSSLNVGRIGETE